MENSMNEAEAHQSFRSPPRRRRSTFFERRDSIVPHTMPEIVNPNKKESEVNERRSDDMTSYYQKLLAEKEMWKKEVNERRNKYDDLKQLHYQTAIKAPSRSGISYSALSNEDIEFLKGKPNISKLIDSHQKLHKSVLVTSAFYRRANELDEVVLAQSENIVSTVTEYILENSTVGPIE